MNQPRPAGGGRRILRRVTSVGAVTGTALALSACGVTVNDPADDRPVVLTTFTVLADMIQVVGGDDIVVKSLTKPGAEIHGYEPTPGDLRSAAEADLVIDNGLGLEAWFDQFIEDAEAPHVVASEGVTPIPIASGEYEGSANPHAWMSPANAEIYVDNIVDALSELDPEHADDFRANGDAYIADIEDVADDLELALSEIPEAARVLVTCEGAFSYLARDAAMQEQYLWPVNAEQEARPQQVESVIEAVDAADVPAVFCESTVSDAAMQQVVDATGADYGGILYVDSLSTEDGPVPTYLDLLRYNSELIADGLGGQP